MFYLMFMNYSPPLRHPLICVSFTAKIHGTALDVILVIHVVFRLDPFHHVEHVWGKDGEGHGSKILPGSRVQGLVKVTVPRVPTVLLLPGFLHPLNQVLVGVVRASELGHV